MGGGTFDVYCVCEEMARIDLGVATAVLATFLGSDPITVGATPEQKKVWLTKIAEEGILFAYGATEPEAGSDLGSLRTTADPVREGDRVVGYKINGNKQWISNGGIADAYTVWPTRRRAELVHRGKGREGFHPRQAGRQARHPPEQHGGARVQTTFTSMPTGWSAASKARD
jgi:alkylation response protein AidB-like acyl-CoA dehydrogenase